VSWALLERRGVPFDVISVLPRHLAHVPVLSERYPGLRMVLDHLAHPPLGSDWPVAELAGGYQRVWSAISSVLGELSPADRDAVLGGTARVFYQLGEAE
jgi:L-fucono-1,5-lactonase